MFAAQSPTIYLVLIAIVVVFGVGAVVIGRRGSKPSAPPSVSTTTRPTATSTTRDVSAPPVQTPAPSIEASAQVDDVAPPVEIAPVVDAAPGVDVKYEKSRGVFAKALASIRGRGRIDQETWDDLEETLLRSDVGVAVCDALIGTLKAQVSGGNISGPEELFDALRREMKTQVSATDRSLTIDDANAPSVWLFVGVNGVGKTTTIGKLGAAQAANGKKVLMAAGDTFRAAAAEQLQTWATRSGAEFVRGAEGGDPASVIYDGIQAAGARGVDLVLADTAGRLQNKQNLMDELRKVRRVADRGPGAVTEVLLVIDATTGQNGLSQAREFAAATDVTGVVLTKLDGSAKGGIVFAIETTLGIPVKLVGLGEGIDDLMAFDPDEFIDALVD